MTSHHGAQRGCGIRGNYDIVLGYRHLVICILVVITSSVGVHSAVDSPAPAPGPALPNFPIFNQHEGDAMNAVLEKWSVRNPKLKTFLNWSPDEHPCNASYMESLYEEVKTRWLGVECTSEWDFMNSTGHYWIYTINKLLLIGSKQRCVESSNYVYPDPVSCGLITVKGELLSEIGKLTNLSELILTDNPELTGAVPNEILQIMPNWMSAVLSNNSLSGPLPTISFSNYSKLTTLFLDNNYFSGNLKFTDFENLSNLGLQFLDLGFNQLDGFIDLQGLNATSSIRELNLNNNQFSGFFSISPNFTPRSLSIANNKLSGPFPLETINTTYLYFLDISGNRFSGSFDFSKVNSAMESLKYLNFSGNNFDGVFSTGPYLDLEVMDLSNNNFSHIIFHDFNKTNDYMPSLKNLSMKNNKFDGKFPDKIWKLKSLEFMYADQNLFGETLELPEISSRDKVKFEVISLTNNSYSRVIYTKTGLFSTPNLEDSRILFLGGNPYCNKIDTILLSIICRLHQLSKDLKLEMSHSNYTLIVAFSASALLALALLVTFVFVWRLLHRIKALRSILNEFEKKEVKPNLYSYKEIKLATRNFDKQNKLGEGAFGIVYKGELPDGSIVAVKKLTISSTQMLIEFLNEVVVISGLKHRNLVKLKGCCLGDGEQRMLVFEFVENGNLAEALMISGGIVDNIEHAYLGWSTRFNIIVGIARGLAYLHEDLQSPVIHRDIKAANILLDQDFNPKIADFGLAFLYPTLDNEATHLTLMQCAGTRGYCSPEYALRGQISTASDVYSFGILVLEIVSGRKNIDLQKPDNEKYLRDWAWKQFIAQEVPTIIDLNVMYDSLELEAIKRVISIALACVHFIASRRPKMHDAVAMLLGNMALCDVARGFEHGEEDGGGGSWSTASLETSALLLTTANGDSLL